MHRRRAGARDGWRLQASAHPGRGKATSVIRIIQQIGGSFGIALLAVVLQQHAAGAITTAGLAGAFADTFWWALAITGIALLPTLLLPGGPSDTARPVNPRAPRPAHGT